MNERIKQLARQAQKVVGHTDGGYTEIKVLDQEKFAELIVIECLKMCKTAVGNADYNTGRLHCLNNIKEHFGIEW